MLRWKNLSFLNNIKYPDFKVEEGECIFLIGDSGCGKSSLLKLLNGINHSSSGDIFYRGENISTLDMTLYRRNVTLFGQDIFLFDSTVKENFQLFYELRNLVPPEDTIICHWLDFVKLDIHIDTDCTIMSGGEKQRVALAIFLSFQPDLLLLDEPTSALDDQTSRSIFANLQSLSSTKIIISHNLSHSSDFGDRVLNLNPTCKEDVTIND